MKIHHPWQRGPAELIEAALGHLHRRTDADLRVAFLLLDVGVEITCKTFLTLPGSTTGATGSYNERHKAAQGHFHEVIEGIRKVAGDRVVGLDLSHATYYHSVRNRLYHDPVVLGVPHDQVKGYAEFAVGLLKALLNVDLAEHLQSAIASGTNGKRKRVPAEKRLHSEVPNSNQVGRKYRPLYEWLISQRDQAVIHLSFRQIESILGAQLPQAARDHQAWWANHAGNSQAKAWLGAGWRVDGVRPSAEEVTFRRE